jgi:NAD(P)-dependent dehydrogenase (short-subunit alcohol dehydrogenase family)
MAVQDLFSLNGKTALVTGSSRGLGRAIAQVFAEAGASLILVGRTADTLATAQRELAALGGKVSTVVADLHDPAGAETLCASVLRDLGQIDILVNNVADGQRSRPEELALEDWQRVVRVILDGTFLCSQEAGRRMIARGRGGSIVNISSIAGSSALGRGNFVYSVAKGGVNQFTRELAIEWSPHGIRVNAIQPAQILTPAVKRMFDDPRLDPASLKERLLRGIPLGRLGEPEDVAKGVVFLASDAAAWITGIMLPVDGGNLALNGGGDRIWPAGT